MRVSLLIPALLVSSPGATAPLWQNTISGMSLAELRAAQPKLRDAPPKGDGQHRNRCDYTIGEVSIETMTFTSCFHLVNDKLVMVGLFSDGPLDYANLKVMLAGKYGKAISEDDCSGRASLNECTIVFRGPEGSTITAGRLNAFDIISNYVHYEAIPQGADQL